MNWAAEREEMTDRRPEGWSRNLDSAEHLEARLLFGIHL